MEGRARPLAVQHITPGRSFMRRRVWPVLSLLLALAFTVEPALAASPSIDEKTQGMRRIDGFVPMHWDESTGKLWMEVTAFGTEMIYVTSLSTGVGSNDIGLDRSQLDATRPQLPRAQQ